MKRGHGVALLLIDVINAFEFPGSASIPVVYVNDNFGCWSSDFKATVRECTNPRHAGHLVSEMLRPHPGDYFVLEPRHSGF